MSSRLRYAALVLALTPPFATTASAQVVASAAPKPPVPASRQEPPAVREVVRMAIAAARSRGPAATQAVARRARLSGLVPELRFGAERGQQQDLSLSDTGTSARSNAAQGDALKLQASLTFDLARLVFAPEEVRLLSVERWLSNDLQELVQQVVRLYFRQRRLARAQHTRALDPESSPDDAADSELEEISALLDILTEGGFSGARGGL